MAARRVTGSSVNWSAIAERVHPNQRLNFNNFKTKSDKYLRRLVVSHIYTSYAIIRFFLHSSDGNFINTNLCFSVLANPEAAPKIDWAAYKSKVAIPGLVESFQKNYEALKVPYPADNVSASVDAQAQQIKSEVESFKSDSKKRVIEYNKSIEHIKSLLPFDQMTMEDYRDAYPELALDPINKPTFWPHTADEQLGYKDDNAAVVSKH